jgi:hypothetical protein
MSSSELRSIIFSTYTQHYFFLRVYSICKTYYMAYKTCKLILPDGLIFEVPPRPHPLKLTLRPFMLMWRLNVLRPKSWWLIIISRTAYRDECSRSMVSLKSAWVLEIFTSCHLRSSSLRPLGLEISDSPAPKLMWTWKNSRTRKIDLGDWEHLGLGSCKTQRLLKSAFF